MQQIVGSALLLPNAVPWFALPFSIDCFGHCHSPGNCFEPAFFHTHLQPFVPQPFPLCDKVQRCLLCLGVSSILFQKKSILVCVFRFLGIILLPISWSENLLAIVAHRSSMSMMTHASWLHFLCLCLHSWAFIPPFMIIDLWLHLCQGKSHKKYELLHQISYSVWLELPVAWLESHSQHLNPILCIDHSELELQFIKVSSTFLHQTGCIALQIEGVTLEDEADFLLPAVLVSVYLFFDCIPPSSLNDTLIFFTSYRGLVLKIHCIVGWVFKVWFSLLFYQSCSYYSTCPVLPVFMEW